MKRLVILLSIILGILLALTPLISHPVSSAFENEKIRVMIEYRPGHKTTVERVLIQAGGEFHYAFDDLNSFALTLPTPALDGIARNPHVVSIEEDPRRYLTGVLPPLITQNLSLLATGDPYAEQVVPYGIDMVQARDVWDANRDGIVDAGAPTGAGKTVCIIDSGLYTAHEDFVGVNVVGGWPPTGDNPWNNDGLGHGTHVTGTITAMNNSIGVVGVTPGTVDLYIVRVFDNDGGWVNASSLMYAADLCGDAGADIISMSLSGARFNKQEERAFDSLYAAGILSIAAASNEGTSAYHYPASYDSVISVGALDSSMVVADFSNFNDQVELTAPGVAVLSTVPYIETNTVTVDGITYAANHIEYSGRGSVTGDLVNGGLCGTLDPENWSGKVVLCQRGTYSFAEKVLNVEGSGGLAALLYNNVSGNFYGTLDPATSSIIGSSLSQEDGEFLVANKLGATAAVVSNPPTDGSGYEAWNGTSMATPHVSGVAALVWSCLPSATNVQVREALNSTALDLGAAGRDDYYGFGLVQAFGACNALNPTSVDLISFTATGAKRSVTLAWETSNEFENLGFNLYRSETLAGERVRINKELIPSLTPPGSMEGAVYEYVDTGADLKSGKLSPNQTYYYWLEDVDFYGGSELYGPVTAKASAR